PGRPCTHVPPPSPSFDQIRSEDLAHHHCFVQLSSRQQVVHQTTFRSQTRLARSPGHRYRTSRRGTAYLARTPTRKDSRLPTLSVQQLRKSEYATPGKKSRSS